MIAVLTSKSALRQIEAIEKQQQLARLSVAGFIRYRYMATGRTILWNWHLDLLSEVLDAIRMRQLCRTIINMPPRFLKSEVVSQAWQAWMIGRENSPRSSMVSASYAASLAHRDSRKTLEIIQSPWYRGIFGEIAMIKVQQDDWETAGGASRAAAGALGPVTGKGGDHLLADDLLKPTEANSELVREKTNEWNGETFRSRLNDIKTGTITHLCQRLHERDPAGYLLAQQKNPDADQFHHINLPLENYEGRAKLYSFGRFRHLRKRGELLHPARIGPKEVAAMKVAMKANFEGQYNQRPQKMEGGLLRPRLLNRHDKSPQQLVKDLGMPVFGYFDLATREKQRDKDDPDYTVVQLWARDQLQRKWLLHVWRKQCSMDEAAAVVLELHKEWKVSLWKGEKGGLQNVFQSVMQQVCRVKHRTMPPIKEMPNNTDKMQKVAPFEAALNAGVVNVPANAPWLPDFEAEMRSWPKGSFDDQVDIAGQACNELEDQVAGDVPMESETLPKFAITGKMLADAERRKKALLGETEDDD